MKVYIAGPLSGKPEEVEKNIQNAIWTAMELIYRDYNPYVPHFSYEIEKLAISRGLNFLYEDYIQRDLEWLDDCDVLLSIGKSPGETIERIYAEHVGIPIVYSIQELQEKFPVERTRKLKVKIMRRNRYHAGNSDSD